MPGKIEIKEVDSLEELAPYAYEWNRLAVNSNQCLPFLSHAWIVSYIETQLPPGACWYCLVALEDSHLVGVFPVIAVPFCRFGFRFWKYQTPNNKHTVSVDFVIEPEREAEVIHLFLAYIFQMRPHCRSLQLPRIPESSSSLPFLADKNKEFIFIREFDGYGSYIKVQGNYQDYRQSLEARFNRNIRRLERKIATLDGVRFEFLSGLERCQEALNRFIAVEASCWKSHSGTAIAKNDSLRHFYEVLCMRLACSGWLEWHFLNIGDKTIAGQLSMKFGRKLIIFKIGYDEAFSSYSPGNVLFAKVIERAFSGGDIDEIDSLSYYAWNENWRMQRRPYYNLRLCPKRPTGILMAAMPYKFLAYCRSSPGLMRLYRSIKPILAFKADRSHESRKSRNDSFFANRRG